VVVGPGRVYFTWFCLFRRLKGKAPGRHAVAFVRLLHAPLILTAPTHIHLASSLPPSLCLWLPARLRSTAWALWWRLLGTGPS